MSEIAASGDRTVLVRTVRYSPPMFDFASSASAKYEADDGGSTLSRIQEFKILDPAFAITDGLCAHLKSAFGFAEPAPGRVLIKSDDLDEIIEAVGISQGFILDVRNVAWFTNTDPRSAKNYYMGYTVKVRLIDASARRIVRSGEFDLRAPASDYRKYSERSLRNGAQIREDLDTIVRVAVERICGKTLSEKG
jgi:hypothetical protein